VKKIKSFPKDKPSKIKAPKAWLLLKAPTLEKLSNPNKIQPRKRCSDLTFIK